MPAAIFVSYRPQDLDTIKILLVFAIVMLIGFALYDRWPKWRA